MSARYAGSFYSRRLVVVSSDNDIFEYEYDNLPPSDPPEDDEDDEPMLAPPVNEDDEPMLADSLDLDRNPFLTSDDIPFDRNISPSSDDVPLALVLRGRDYFPRRLRSSSLPTPIQARMSSDHDIMFTPNTERKHLKGLITQKRLETFSRNKGSRLFKAAEEKAEKEHARELLFNDILDTIQKAGANLADFLKYVFKPDTQRIFDWKWQGFFQNQETVKDIFGYWTSTDYNQTTRTFISDWVISQAKLIVGQESKAISDSKFLRKTSMVVDEEYFLDYSLESITDRLRTLAPGAFALFDAFSSTDRQKRELKEKSRRKQELVCFNIDFSQSNLLTLSDSGARISHSVSVEE
jgi:hypothetical protein